MRQHIISSHTSHPHRGRDARRLMPLIRVLALIVIMLLPVQMRAGAADAHPHALLHLLLDARDGSIDHHAAEHGAAHDADHGHAAHSVDGLAPDVPMVEESTRVAGGLAILAALVVLYTIPLFRDALIWPLPPRWRGILLVLDPPPPRFGIV